MWDAKEDGASSRLVSLENRTQDITFPGGLPRFAALSFCFWTLPVIYRLLQSYIAHIALNLPHRPLYITAFIATDWYYWAVLTPCVFWLGARFPLERERLRNYVAIHLPVAVIAAAIHVLLLQLYFYFGEPGPTFAQMLSQVASTYANSFMTYCGILAVSVSFTYNRRVRERELQTANLKNKLSEAQLRALQMQLQPHFLFNTLNSISALTTRNPRDANTMIAQLSELLRVLLAKEPVQEIPLSEELAFLKTYLGIEKVRFQDRLTLNFDIEPETMRAYIPSLILQPIVENAIRHGIGKKRGNGTIGIVSRRIDGKLHLTIYDNGLGFRKSGFEFSDGIGLKNTISRLREMYGEEHFFGIASESETGREGVEVTLIIPFRSEFYAKDKNSDN